MFFCNTSSSGATISFHPQTSIHARKNHCLLWFANNHICLGYHYNELKMSNGLAGHTHFVAFLVFLVDSCYVQCQSQGFLQFTGVLELQPGKRNSHIF